MSFAALLLRLGGMGRFQVRYVAALAVPLLLLASHNLLQNFTAGVPEHHCRAGDLPLLVSIPTDGHRQPQRCRRYVEPQWHLLEANATANGSAAATEPCRDGWVYRDGAFARTIVTEVTPGEERGWGGAMGLAGTGRRMLRSALSSLQPWCPQGGSVLLSLTPSSQCSPCP
uniref:Uncharacterized protein n=1 Tax=Amazona collaria TaxID=241587 RepID=A0A8B9FV04_9PSIT